MIFHLCGRLGNAVRCAEVLVGVGVGQDGGAAAVLDGGAAEALEGIVRIGNLVLVAQRHLRQCAVAGRAVGIGVAFTERRVVR